MGRRHHEVSRLEGFSDAVFGFALALLVVSGATLDTVADLIATARSFMPFALTFAMIGWIWHEHSVFFRRYGLQDPWTVFLNLVLLFVVLFYVYPLKFAATQIVAMMTGGQPTWGATITEAQLMMLIYSSGVVLIFTCFVMLYRHAWRQRTGLGLTLRDETELRFGLRSHVISMSLGLLSLAIAIVNADWTPIAGMIYVLMGPLQAWNGYRAGATLDQLDRAAATTPQT